MQEPSKPSRSISRHSFFRLITENNIKLLEVRPEIHTSIGMDVLTCSLRVSFHSPDGNFDSKVCYGSWLCTEFEWIRNIQEQSAWRRLKHDVKALRMQGMVIIDLENLKFENTRL